MVKTYLGDGVYAEHTGYDVVLTTSNGIMDTNTIVLEPAVLRSFNAWLVRLYNSPAENEQHLQPPAPEPVEEEPESAPDGGAVDPGV